MNIPRKIARTFLLFLCVCFIHTLSTYSGYAQTTQEQAKILYYEEMLNSESILASEKQSYYDSLIVIYRELHDIDKLRACLLNKTNAYYREGDYLSSYKTGLSMIETFDGKETLTDEQLLQKNVTLQTMGKSCVNLGMYDEAISNFFAIIRGPETRYTIQAYSYLGFVFMQMKQMEQSKIYNEMALDLLSKADSVSRMKSSSIVYNSMAGYYYNLNPSVVDSALYYLSHSLDYYDYGENFVSKSFVYHNMAIIYLEMKEYTMAENYMKRAIEMSEEEPYNTARYLQNLAYILYKSDRIDEAEEYYYKALEAAEGTNTIRVKSAVLTELSNLYYKKQQYKKAIDLLKEGVSLRDSISNNQSLEKVSLLSQQLDNYKIITEKELLEKELQVIRLSNQNKSIILGVLVAVLAAISIITFLQIRKLRRNSERNVERETKIAEEQIREEYRNSLDEKDRKLASNALFLMKANEILISLEQSIRQLSVWKDTTKRNEIIKEMETVINSYNSGQGWEEFKLYFEQIHPSFYENLNNLNSGLSKMQQRLCALLVLNMNTKEIAEITNRSVRTIETLIYRIRKDLDIQPEEKTTTFLRQFL